MSYEPPEPPAELPQTLVDPLDECSPEQLEAVSRYVDALSEYRERESRLDDSGDEPEDTGRDVPEDLPDTVPESVPSKATITIKEIKENRYYYWQWRDGDRIRSEYEGPVDGG